MRMMRWKHWGIKPSTKHRFNLLYDIANIDKVRLLKGSPEPDFVFGESGRRRHHLETVMGTDCNSKMAKTGTSKAGTIH